MFSDDKDVLWDELNLGGLVSSMQPSYRLADQVSFEKINKSKILKKHNDIVQKPSYSVLMGRYDALPSKPKSIQSKKLDLLADPIKGRFSRIDKFLQDDSEYRNSIGRNVSLDKGSVSPSKRSSVGKGSSVSPTKSIRHDSSVTTGNQGKASGFFLTGGDDNGEPENDLEEQIQRFQYGRKPVGGLAANLRKAVGDAQRYTDPMLAKKSKVLRKPVAKNVKPTNSRALPKKDWKDNTRVNYLAKNKGVIGKKPGPAWKENLGNKDVSGRNAKTESGLGNNNKVISSGYGYKTTDRGAGQKAVLPKVQAPANARKNRLIRRLTGEIVEADVEDTNIRKPVRTKVLARSKSTIDIPDRLPERFDESDTDNEVSQRQQKAVRSAPAQMARVPRKGPLDNDGNVITLDGLAKVKSRSKLSPLKPLLEQKPRRARANKQDTSKEYSDNETTGRARASSKPRIPNFGGHAHSTGELGPAKTAGNTSNLGTDQGDASTQSQFAQQLAQFTEFQQYQQLQEMQKLQQMQQMQQQLQLQQQMNMPTMQSMPAAGSNMPMMRSMPAAGSNMPMMQSLPMAGSNMPMMQSMPMAGSNIPMMQGMPMHMPQNMPVNTNMYPPGNSPMNTNMNVGVPGAGMTGPPMYAQPKDPSTMAAQMAQLSVQQGAYAGPFQPQVEPQWFNSVGAGANVYNNDTPAALTSQYPPAQAQVPPSGPPLYEYSNSAVSASPLVNNYTTPAAPQAAPVASAPAAVSAARQSKRKPSQPISVSQSTLHGIERIIEAAESESEDSGEGAINRYNSAIRAQKGEEGNSESDDDGGGEDQSQDGSEEGSDDGNGDGGGNGRGDQGVHSAKDDATDALNAALDNYQKQHAEEFQREYQKYAQDYSYLGPDYANMPAQSSQPKGHAGGRYGQGAGATSSDYQDNREESGSEDGGNEGSGEEAGSEGDGNDEGDEGDRLVQDTGTMDIDTALKRLQRFQQLASTSAKGGNAKGVDGESSAMYAKPGATATLAKHAKSLSGYLNAAETHLAQYRNLADGLS